MVCRNLRLKNVYMRFASEKSVLETKTSLRYFNQTEIIDILRTKSGRNNQLVSGWRATDYASTYVPLSLIVIPDEPG